MKHIKYTIGLVGLSIGSIFLGACNKYLDRAPLADVTPKEYLNTEADLATYTVTRYNFPSHAGWGMGTFVLDNHTDNQVASGYSTIWVPGEFKVSATGGDYDFTRIRHINYFLEMVLPKWKSNKLTGNLPNIEHYIGEAYFLRAFEYFSKLQNLGDFPIVKNTLIDNMGQLTAASVRNPRNEVARFILADLDSAINLLNVSPPNGKNRISKDVALLFKSRVGLYEGSWLKYHGNTARVPGGPGWPGAQSHPNFSINLAEEINFFLSESMAAAEQVADKVELVANIKDDGQNSSNNPYYNMFWDVDMSSYSEVLMWRSYSFSLGVTHNVNHYMNQNGGNSGYTKGLVESFTMANGLPIYANGSGYLGDDDFKNIKAGRDNRLQIFMKAPGELRVKDKMNTDGTPILESNPAILDIAETRYVTGYALKKGMSYLAAQLPGSAGSTGSITFRATEAYLNYLEASYLKNNFIDAKASAYWQKIRNRAGVNQDFMHTVNNTDMNEEAKDDFGAYSSGTLLSDKILFNIRRERRLELVAEGFRYQDLKRWRALDQLKSSPYIVEGFKLWSDMEHWYVNTSGVSTLVEPNTPGKTANVSAKSESLYLRPYRINNSANNLVLNGYKWANAHYLNPIAVQHFTITSTDGSASSSTLYQNPGWPITANEGAID